MTSATKQRRSSNARHTGTRNELIAGARASVIERGVAQATSRDITARAGANLAAITYYFGSKEALVAEALFAELRRPLDDAIELLASDDDPTSAMLATIQSLMSSFEAQQSHVPVYLQAMAEAARAGAVADEARELLGTLRQHLATRIDELQKVNVVPQWVEPSAMAALIIAVANGIALLMGIDREHVEPRNIAAQFAALLIAAQPSAGHRPT